MYIVCHGHADHRTIGLLYVEKKEKCTIDLLFMIYIEMYIYYISANNCVGKINSKKPNSSHTGDENGCNRPTLSEKDIVIIPVLQIFRARFLVINVDAFSSITNNT